MAYFLTGATGFIGRHLVLRLLANRDGDLYVLVRKGSLGRLEELRERYWPARVAELALRGAAEQAPASALGIAGAHAGRLAAELTARIHPVAGDLARPLLGLDEQQIEELGPHISDFIHLAALYDMSASERDDRQANVVGTRHALELARALEVERFHHISSVAVAGSYRGAFNERMFDEGQQLPSPYHRTKFEAERLVREQPYVAWRIYRPAIVVGDSRTGEIEKVDGPYYFFKSIKRLRSLLPEWLPLAGIDLGRTNIVPVDWVADALDHLMHEPGLDGAAFHLGDPQGQSIAKVINLVAEAAHAPRMAVTVDGRLSGALRSGPLSLLMRMPPLAQARRLALHELGIPEQVLANMDLLPRFDSRETRRLLAGAGLERPPALEEYVGRLWAFWERELDRDMRGRRTLREAIVGNHVMITGASSGIGRAAARKIAEAGGIPILVARNVERLEQVRAEIVAAGGTAYVYAADLTVPEQIDDVLARIFADHQRIDALVNNAGRSIRRSVALSYDRMHDYERTMQLNYFAAVRLILGVLPHMRERRRGHIVNVSTIGVQASPPRFSAYVASKAALDAFTRVVASEVLGDGVTFTTIHMPLVRTPMIEPTKIYRAFPAITPDEAAEMICEALRSHPKQIGTRLGTTAEVLYALAPKVVDRILNTAYSVFPESAAARGEVVVDEPASLEQIAMATLTRGVHW
ncbi:MAG TPA: SDR family oxidoreductase [Solirubrobacteraceae bacterium]|nr:SDR family oxidoreductase [Solirubrobacteraceae bacterium]